MRDPYQVLGIPSTATDEEVKKAYRNLARKYHPDNYHDNPLEGLAQERMKEINEAYETIRTQRKAAQSGGQSYGGYTGGYSQGYNAGAYGGVWQRVRLAISQGNLNLAEELLNAQTDHNGEWNFLKGPFAISGAGWTRPGGIMRRRCRWTRAMRSISGPGYAQRKRCGIPSQRLRARYHRQLRRGQLQQPVRCLRLYELPVWQRRIFLLLLTDHR